MNKLKFEARVLDLYSVDYEYLQDEIEAQGRKILRQTLQNPGTAMVIKGFKLRASPSDSTKMQVYHEGTWSSAISSVGRLVETSENIDLIEPSDSTAGVTNYVFIRSSTGYGTYNKASGLVELNVRLNIDYHDFEQVYDREVDVWEIAVYTADEISALSSESYANLIPLGDFIANGASPITEVSTSGRVDAKTFVADGSISTAMISVEGMDLPQTNVANSVTYDDTFNSVPTDLEDDLNKIRYFIREIKGTDNWDDFLANNLSVFDATVNNLHSNGVLEGVRDGFQVIPNSTGLSVLVRSGKALLEGVIEGIPDTGEEILTFDPQPVFFRYAEYEFIPDHTGSDYPFSLDYQHVIVTASGNSPGADTYEEDVAFTVNSSSGVVTCLDGAGINNEPTYWSYYYGFERYDLVELGPDHDLQIIKGISATSTGRIPDVPPVSDGYIPIAIVRVDANITNFTTSNVFEYKSFVPEVRNLHFASATDVSGIKSNIDKVAYHIDTGYVDAGYTQWSLTTYDGRDVAVSSTVNSFITSSVNCDEGDALWVIFDKNIWVQTIDVEWETSTGTGVLDGSVSFDLESRHQIRYVPLLVTNYLTQGIHQLKITVTAASGNVAFYGIINGNTGIRHVYPHMTEFESQVLEKFLVDDANDNILIGNSVTAPNITGTYNVAIGYQAMLDNVTGDYNVAIGYQALKDVPGGSYNTGVGASTLQNVTTGSYNTAVGYQSLYNNLSGVGNVAVGRSALFTNTQGDYNVAIGNEALLLNTSGYDNIAIGREVLEQNTAGLANVALGYRAMRQNTTGHYNVAIGYEALDAVNQGDNNVAIGQDALGVNTVGNNNVAIGYGAIDSNTNGSYNIGIGSGVLTSLNGGDNNTVIGRIAGLNITTGGDNSCFGYSSGSGLTTGSRNILLGKSAGTGISTANDTIVIGSNLAGANGSDRCYIDNIWGSSSSSAANVVVDSSGRLYRGTNTQQGVPIGTIVAWFPHYFTTSDNSGTRYDASPAITLPDYWQECDGTVVANSGSPMYASGTGHVPRLDDDRFLMGNVAANAGQTGGSSNIPNQAHNSISHNHQWYDVYSKGSHNIGLEVHGENYYDGRTYNSAGSIFNISHYSGVINHECYTNNSAPSINTHTFSLGANRPKYFAVRFIIRTA